MKRFIMFFITISIVYSQDLLPSEAPLNPNFLKYLKDKESDKFNRINSDGYYNAIIPHPTVGNINRPVNFKINASLPTRYDLRTEGLVTSVKDQGDCGSCWLFSSMGSLESYWKKIGLGTYNFSENHAGNEDGFENDYCDGGNATRLTPYFLRGDGPISENEDPYPYGLGKKLLKPLFTALGIVTEARYLPNDMDVIKQYIYDYGGITSGMQWSGEFYDYFNQADNTFFYSNNDTDTPDAGHGIVVVGWDDNIQTAGGSGAWIIKNSWGDNFGENGYFYLSYQDVFFNVEGHTWPIGWPGRIDYNNQLALYYYDTFGWINSYGWNNGPDYALVKYVLNNDESITRVGTYVPSSNSTVKFEFFNTFNNGTLADLLTATDTYNCDYSGYYSYDLPVPLVCNNGQEIFVKVSYSTPGYNWPIPIETYNENWSWDYSPQIEKGVFWVSDTGDGNQSPWYPMGSDIEDRKHDPCVKLYTMKNVTTQTVLGEGFNNSPFPPAGWTQSVTNNTNTWMQGNPQDNNFSTIDPNSQASAICPYDDYAYQEEYLYSPVFVLPSGNAELEFYSGYSTAWLTGASMYLFITTDLGTNWEQIWQASNDGQSWSWRKQNIDLSAYAGNDEVVLAWGYVGQGGDLVGLDGVKLVSNGTVGVDDYKRIVYDFVLEQNFPNPFNPITNINFYIPKNVHVELNIYDLLGRKIKSLLSKEMKIGKYSMMWDGKDDSGKSVSNGIYIYKLETVDVHLSQKMIFMK